MKLERPGLGTLGNPVHPPSDAQGGGTQRLHGTQEENGAQRGEGLVSGHPGSLAVRQHLASFAETKRVLSCGSSPQPCQPPGLPPQSSFRPRAGGQAAFPRASKWPLSQKAACPLSALAPSRAAPHCPEHLQTQGEGLCGEVLMAGTTLPPPSQPPGLLRN